MKNIFNNKYTYLLVSLVIAIWLFISVSAPGSLSTRDATSKQIRETSTKVVTVKDVALQPIVDNDKYFVTGYPSTVDVELTGTTSLVETTQKTKNFRVSLDLTGLDIGKHKVELKVTGLNKAIKYKVKPQYVNVNIQRKVERVFPIQIAFDENVIKSGYKVGRATANPDTVKVSGAKSEVNKVVQVVASVDIAKDVRSDVDKEALLQALDKDGKIVNVVLDPQTTHVTIPITVPSKKVTLKTKQTGTALEGYEYSLKLSTNSAVVYGDEDTIESLSELEIPVDITDIKETTTKKITLAKVFEKQIWEASPKTVEVTITVTKNSDSDTTTDETGNSTTTDNT
ncbi:hypothetical protein RD055328_09220 [Companilactobacillus sp. RD055328]|uniref:CdaR family protein n=1 Tax=Companilactobacillus sp. RD055328 TaxID=2916634 RepID=UPI001FC88B6E|nr:CdaR family protein [Companilactobacillus sp. RD055328]GKQ42999.1 hypothetical protein RD055328_09220 [Companilactobacillus sp. RD055328]